MRISVEKKKSECNIFFFFSFYTWEFRNAVGYS